MWILLAGRCQAVPAGSKSCGRNRCPSWRLTRNLGPPTRRCPPATACFRVAAASSLVSSSRTQRPASRQAWKPYYSPCSLLANADPAPALPAAPALGTSGGQRRCLNFQAGALDPWAENGDDNESSAGSHGDLAQLLVQPGTQEVAKTGTQKEPRCTVPSPAGLPPALAHRQVARGMFSSALTLTKKSQD